MFEKAKRQARHNHGFSLLELTCALFVITVAGFGSIQLYSIGMDKIVMMREYDIATEVLRNEMEQLRAEPCSALGVRTVFEAASPALEGLHRPETAIQALDRAPGLKEVTVSLRWQSRHGRWIGRELTTLIADKGLEGQP